MILLRLQSLAKSYSGDVRGNLLLWVAAALPLLLAVSGAASDYAMFVNLKTQMQAAADAAALAAAHEVPLAKSNPDYLINSARSFAEHEMGSSMGGGEAGSPQSAGQDSRDTSGTGMFAAIGTMLTYSDSTAVETAPTTIPDSSSGTPKAMTGNYDIGVTYDADQSKVNVAISVDWTPVFATFLNSGSRKIEVQATAQFFGAANVCVLGLSPNTISGIRLWNSAQMTGENCAVYSNTLEKDGLAVMDSAILEAQHICVSGGASIGSAKAVTPQPVTDCPPLADPLAARKPPPVGMCDHTNHKVSSGSATLAPGVYCGGLTISGAAKVTLDPGIYIIKDGPLVVSSTASLTGEGVGFYLTGNLSTMLFTAMTTISLAAPTSGELAGLLFFEDRAAKGIRLHRIASNNARNLLGTIYLPVSILNIDSTAPVADQSAYTAIVTKSLQLQSGPNLILNTDYDLTDVPVPQGIKGSSRVVLSE